MMIHRTGIWMIFLGIMLLITMLASGCTAPGQSVGTPAEPVQTEPAQTEPAQLANPASQYCVDQGGTLAIEERGDGGQIGVCYFEDNLQCEEWALLNGDCPVDGVKVTGYATEAGRFCAITGGTYAITSEPGADPEQGTCTFNNGVVCDAWDYYNGACDPDQEPTPMTVSNTQWFVNQAVGYALEVPGAWSEQTLPDQNDGAIHGMAYTGAEGGIEVYWGVGFGGACPGGTQPVQLAQGEVPACYARQDDGTEAWSQIGYQVEGGNDFSIRAYTSDAQPSSRDLVLQVLSTVTFRMPTALAIQPLSMEVCDGQAQAMAHTLEVLVGAKATTPIIPTQSEDLLDDYVNNAWGTGCMATVTGTGELYNSPSAVVDALGSMLVEQGWTQDPQLDSGIATGIGAGYRKNNQISMVTAVWQPDASANCPKDQPVTACNVSPAQQNYTITMNSGEEVPQQEAASPPQRALVGSGSTRLVFDSTRAGPYRDLYTMNSDGSEANRLTHGDSNSFAGPWSRMVSASSLPALV